MEILWILIGPLAWFFFAKHRLRHTFTWKELGISMVIITVLVSATIGLGSFSQTADTEIWNGYVLSKKRVQDTYMESYRCNCYTSCSGSGKNRSCTEHCSTCYRKHWTVDWTADTTVGSVRFKKVDRTSSSAWRTPDPANYTACYKGEPVAREKRYTNYVQAVPQSLFHDDAKINTYAEQVPAYPEVHSLYKLDRVINLAGVTPATVNEIDEGLDKALNTLGAVKQANIIVILTDIQDPSYRYAVERKWLGGKKNDIVIFLGIKGNDITWVDVMTWALNSGNELFHVTMRDGITDMKTLDPKKLVPFVEETVMKLYDRPQMKDYEYLKDEIEPPGWVLILAIFFALFGSAGLTWFFHKNET